VEPVAIVGMACRFPGAPSLGAFWALLREGRHGIEAVPEDRWDVEALFDPDPKKPGKVNSRFGGFIADVDRFDAGFFGISPREAVQMDPQQRLLLELSYEALEDAGLPPARLAGSDTGVFVGLMSNDYLHNQLADQFRNIDVHTASGAGFCMTANRLSYQFDLHGPSVAVDSACSSSLVAVFLACQSLWSGQATAALAAGVNLILSPAFNVFYAKGGLSAPDGKCKTFSAAADGIGRGEGAGVVVLKTLSQARQDGDRIYAVIRGGAVNHDGRSNGLTAPNRWAQERLLRAAYRHAGVSAKDVGYVELHGTGTLIGDPIEAQALGAILAEGREAEDRCRVGSVKTNVGHLEGAAGVAGLIKLALMLHHREIPPSLWFDAPNPHIPFERLPLLVQQARAPWPDDRSTLAGISSFGLGGTNAHLVMEGVAPVETRRASLSTAGEPAHFLLLSARSEQALRDLAARYAQALFSTAEEDVAAVCHSTALRRSLHEYRAAFVAPDRGRLVERLLAFARGTVSHRVWTGRHRQSPRRKILWAYPHPEHVNGFWVETLCGRSPAFRAALDRCDAALRDRLEAPPPPLVRYGQGAVLSPADPFFSVMAVAVQIALTALWRTAGLKPDAVAGEGLGLLAAREAAGALSLADALVAAAQPSGWRTLGSSPRQAASEVPCHDAGSGSGDCADTDWPASPSSKPAWSWLAGMPAAPEGDVLLCDTSYSRATEPVPAWLACPAAGAEDALLEMLAPLSTRHNLDWSEVLGEPLPFVSLPAYPWQRSRYWLEKVAAGPLRPASHLELVAVPVPVESSTAPVETGVALRPEPPRALPASAAPAPSAPPVGARFDRGLLLALSEPDRRPPLVEYLREQVGAALEMRPAEVDLQVPLNNIGIDSLTAVEVKNRVERDLRVVLPVVKFLDGYAIEDFAVLILQQLREEAAAAPEGHIDPRLAEEVKALSADELDRMLSGLMPELAVSA
jgi:acyl transferase domain-containing protein